jgi:hypothetical protein
MSSHPEWGDPFANQTKPSPHELVPDNEEAYREFRFRCGLIKAINVLSGQGSAMTLYLDGFPNGTLNMGQTEFRFDSTLEHGPVADITFKANCVRQDEARNATPTIIFASLVFKDRAQMELFVVAVATAPNQEKNVPLDSRGTSGWPLAAGVGFGMMSS